MRVVNNGMKYRPFGKLDWQVSILGFGAMRLPQNSPDPGDVDEAESVRMIRHAIDKGVNYVDTAYLYHNARGEGIVGKALENGYRDKVRLATKMPSWAINSKSDMDRFLEKQLRRLQTDTIDFYLLHALNRDLWPNLRKHGVLRWAEQAMAAGRIGILGFSFHDDLHVFKEIVDAYDNWTLCQVQYNYMDISYQAGTKGVRYAANKGLAVVVMEPLRGGSLSRKPPTSVSRILAQAEHQRSPAEWALLWLWEQPEVSVVLSGMSAFDQLEENLSIADKAGPGALTPDEMKLIARARRAFKKLGPIPCTSCGYCQPCKQGVEIPRIFGFYNSGIMYDDMKTARFFYNNPIALKADQRADKCIQCGECAESCPQKIPTPEWLKKVHAELGPK